MTSPIVATVLMIGVVTAMAAGVAILVSPAPSDGAPVVRTYATGIDQDQDGAVDTIVIRYAHVSHAARATLHVEAQGLTGTVNAGLVESGHATLLTCAGAGDHHVTPNVGGTVDDVLTIRCTDRNVPHRSGPPVVDDKGEATHEDECEGDLGPLLCALRGGDAL